MKRLLVLLSIVICPLSAVIVNGYKYKTGNKILYLLAYDQKLDNDDEEVDQLEILKNVIQQWDEEDYIQSVIVSQPYSEDSFCGKINKILDSTDIEVVHPFSDHPLDNITSFLDICDHVTLHFNAFQDFIKNKQRKNYTIELLLNKITNFDVNSLIRQFSNIDLNTSIFNFLTENKNVQYANQEIHNQDEVMNENSVLTFMKIVNNAKDSILQKYNEFYCSEVGDLINKYLTNTKNNGCMIAFVENRCIEDLLKKFGSIKNSEHKDNDGFIRGAFQSNSEKDPKFKNNCFSFFLKSDGDLPALDDSELEEYFRVSPPLQLKIYNDQASPLEKRVYLNQASPLELKIYNGTASFWEKLKHQAYEWKKILIPAAVTGLGVGYWWLKSRSKPATPNLTHK